MTEPYDPEQRFNKRATVYDSEIEDVIPGYRALQDVSHHLLQCSLPEDAFLLVGGSGTGNEAIKYALENPGWKITGFDIAEVMVKTAVSKAEDYGLCDRIEFIHGGIADVLQESFDAATSLLVMHFMPETEKKSYLQQISIRLKPGAKFILADICGDRNSKEFEDSLTVWKSFQLQRRDKKDVEEMLGHVRNDLHVIENIEAIRLLENSGFGNIRHFWKSLLIDGFVMEKLPR